MKRNIKRITASILFTLFALGLFLQPLSVDGAATTKYKWLIQFQDNSSYYEGIAKYDGGYMTVGAGGVIDLFFSDGQALWPKTDIKDTFYDVATNGKRYVAVGDFGTLIHSVDGYDWNQANAECYDMLTRVLWNGKRFIAIGAPTSGGIGSMPADLPPAPVFTSVDGIKWVQQNPKVKVWLKDIAWSGKKYAAVGAAGTIVTSADGVKWTQVKSGVKGDITAIAWNGKKFIAVSGSTVLSSADGVKWTAAKSNISGTVNSIAWSGKGFMAVGNKGLVISSTDGIKWTKESTGISGGAHMKRVIWDGKRFAAVGDGYLIVTR